MHISFRGCALGLDWDLTTKDRVFCLQSGLAPTFHNLSTSLTCNDDIHLKRDQEQQGNF